MAKPVKPGGSTITVGGPPAPARPSSVPWRLVIVVLAVAALAIGARTAPSWIASVGLTGDALDTAEDIAARAARWSTPVLWAAAISMVLIIIWSVIAGRRRAQNDRVVTAIGRTLRITAAVTDVAKVGRGLIGRPRTVRVRLPADFPVEDPKERASLEQAVVRVLGGHWRGDWKASRLRKGHLTIRRTHPPAITDGDENRTDKGRLLIVGRKVFGKDATVKSMKLGAESGRAEAFTLAFPPNANLANPANRDRVEAALTGLFPGLWEMHWDLEGDTVTAYQRPMLARQVPYVPQPITPANHLKLSAAAIAGRLEPGTWDLDGKTPHGLITGETGGGKSYAFLVLAVEALRRGIPVFGIDPKKIELMALENWPGMERLGVEAPEMADIITYLHDLMMHRYTLLRRRQLQRRDLQPILVLLDELLILQKALNDHWALQKAREGIKGGKDHPAIGMLISLIVLARSARIHLCFGVQRPQATLFDEGARDSIRFRLSLGSLTQEGAIQMWGDAHTGTDVPADVPGRGTISTPAGPKEAQVYRLPELDLEVPDDQLPPEDAALRNRLLADCNAAIRARPVELHMEIGGYHSTARDKAMILDEKKPDPRPTPPGAAASEATSAATDDASGTAPAEAVVDELPAEPIMMPAKGLSPGLHVLIEDPDASGSQVGAEIEQVDDITEEDRLLVDYRIDDGRTGQLDLDPDDELPLAG